MRCANDRLGIIGLAVDHQEIRASLSEPVLPEERVAAKPAVLCHSLKNLAISKLLQCHLPMATTCVRQVCQPQLKRTEPNSYAPFPDSTTFSLRCTAAAVDGPLQPCQDPLRSGRLQPAGQFLVTALRQPVAEVAGVAVGDPDQAHHRQRTSSYSRRPRLDTGKPAPGSGHLRDSVVARSYQWPESRDLGRLSLSRARGEAAAGCRFPVGT